MTKTDAEVRDYPCPMEGCGIVMNEGVELRAHLKWDHHWSPPNL